MITMIGENNQGGTPSQSELQWWANQYNLTHPVVADPGFNETVQYLYGDPNFNGSFGLPNMQLLSSGMVVRVSNDWVYQSDINNWLGN